MHPSTVPFCLFFPSIHAWIYPLMQASLNPSIHYPSTHPSIHLPTSTTLTVPCLTLRLSLMTCAIHVLCINSLPFSPQVRSLANCNNPCLIILTPICTCTHILLHCFASSSPPLSDDTIIRVLFHRPFRFRASVTFPTTSSM